MEFNGIAKTVKKIKASWAIDLLSHRNIGTSLQLIQNAYANACINAHNIQQTDTYTNMQARTHARTHETHTHTHTPTHTHRHTHTHKQTHTHTHTHTHMHTHTHKHTHSQTHTHTYIHTHTPTHTYTHTYKCTHTQTHTHTHTHAMDAGKSIEVYIPLSSISISPHRHVTQLLRSTAAAPGRTSKFVFDVADLTAGSSSDLG